MLSSRRRECTRRDRRASFGPPWSVGIPCPGRGVSLAVTRIGSMRKVWVNIRPLLGYLAEGKA